MDKVLPVEYGQVTSVPLSAKGVLDAYQMHEKKMREQQQKQISENLSEEQKYNSGTVIKILTGTSKNRHKEEPQKKKSCKGRMYTPRQHMNGRFIHGGSTVNQVVNKGVRVRKH